MDRQRQEPAASRRFLPWRVGVFVLVSLLSAAPSTARPLREDLGKGLVYYRLHALPADLPPATVKPGPMVLDLRFASLTEAEGTAVEAWLRFHATPTTPLLVLVNSFTAEKLAALLAANEGVPGLLTIGLPPPGFTPDIVVRTSAAADRRAYDALEHGGSLPALITENVDKPREDEAAIIRERSSSADNNDEDDSDELDRPAAEPATVKPRPPPVIDYTLQRAVQVDRALRALKRLPSSRPAAG